MCSCLFVLECIGIFSFLIFRFVCEWEAVEVKAINDLSWSQLTLFLRLPLLLVQTHYTVPDTERDVESLNATIECEQPQPDLYK